MNNNDPVILFPSIFGSRDIFSRSAVGRREEQKNHQKLLWICCEDTVSNTGGFSMNHKLNDEGEGRPLVQQVPKPVRCGPACCPLSLGL